MTALDPVVKERQRSARSRVSRIRMGIVNYLETLALVAQAYQERDWETLGYDGWDAYVGGEFPADKLGIPAEHRQKAIEELRIAGLSTRAIAPVVGLHPSSVARQVSRNATPEPVQGIDGKTYSPARSPVVDAIKQAIDDATERAQDHRSDTGEQAPDGTRAESETGQQVGGAGAGADRGETPAPASTPDHPSILPTGEPDGAATGPVAEGAVRSGQGHSPVPSALAPDPVPSPGPDATAGEDPPPVVAPQEQGRTERDPWDETACPTCGRPWRIP